ncbi:MAG: polysaccharide deacetylase family protein [Flavobacteriia bacterium]|nr:polysaccharide deacetylase family protein [Flavobacteriia bacterium]
MKKIIKKYILGFFVKSKGIISKPIYGGIANVFMLHRILPEELKNEFSINKDLAITPEGLEEWILYFKKSNKDFWSVDELYDTITSKKKLEKKGIVFTIDDGYLDNIIYGLPVFEKYNIPICIFITSCFPNKNAIYWWYLLEKYIELKSEINFRWRGKNIELSWCTKEEKYDAFTILRDYCRKMSKIEINEFLTGPLKLLLGLNSFYNEKLPCSWEQLEQLVDHPLITFAAHTEHHISLGFQTEETIRNEIVTNVKTLKSRLNIEVDFFAFPYGAYDDICQNIEEVDKMKLLFLNHPGNVFSSKRKNNIFIPRMGLTDNTLISRMNEIDNGIFHFSMNGFKRNLN